MHQPHQGMKCAMVVVIAEALVGSTVATTIYCIQQREGTRCHYANDEGVIGLQSHAR